MGRHRSKLRAQSGIDWLRVAVTDFKVNEVSQLVVYPDRYVPDRVLLYMPDSTPVIGERAIYRSKGLRCLIKKFSPDKPAILLVRWNPTHHKTSRNWPLISVAESIDRIALVEAQLLQSGVECALKPGKLSALEYTIDTRHVLDHHNTMTLAARTGLQPYMRQLQIRKAHPTWFNNSASFSMYSKSKQKPQIRQRLSNYHPAHRVLRQELRLKNAGTIRGRLGYETLSDAVDDNFSKAERLFLEYQKRALWLAMKEN